MIHYFKVDPEIVKEPKNWPVLYDTFGFSHGRLIVDPPFSSLASDPTLKLVLDGRFQDCFANRPVPTDRHLGLAVPPAGIGWSERGFNNTWGPLWTTERAALIDKTKDGLAEALAHALCTQSELTIIDPYFDFEARDSKRKPGNRFVVTVAELVNRLEAHSTHSRTLTIHTRPAGGQRPRKLDRIGPALSSCIPTSWELNVFHWPEDKPDFHNRYVLGEDGGIGVCYGFDEKKGTTDVLFLMDRNLSRLVRQNFEPSKTPAPDRWELTKDGSVSRRATHS